MELLADPGIWVSFLTLTILEVILGIDNVIFISIIAGRLPEEKRQPARVLGLTLALVVRIVLLFSIAWLVQLTEPVFSISGFVFSWRDAIFLAGGLFLIAKSTIEIYATVEGEAVHTVNELPAAGMSLVITQIVLLDVVFSFDSILTAIGLTSEIWIIVAAVSIAMAVMLLAARPIGEFVERHLSIKLLALAFLLVIGVVLMAEGLHLEIPKAYIYSALAFSMFVQALVMLAGRKRNTRTTRPGS